MAFRDDARAWAIEWKQTTTTLPDEARADGRYQGGGDPLAVALPVEHARLNLLPEVRDWAIGYFSDAGIPWHHGLGSEPGNHLLSSQVQCVNALGPMVRDPDALVAAFGDVLDIAEPLPVGDPIDPGSYVAFEWVGLDDHLNEHPGSPGQRGPTTPRPTRPSATAGPKARSRSR